MRVCRAGALLPPFRAVREQLDWDEIRSEVGDRPFAEAFLFLLERLEIAPASGISAPERTSAA